MKKYEIIILNEVDKQIIEILDFIYSETYNKSLVKNISDIIYGACNSLKVFPYRYQIGFDDVRILNIKSFRIFYEIFEDENKIVVFQILGQSQDY